MGKPVQHESPDYSYQPAGLMAGEWGKTGHRTEVEPYVQLEGSPEHIEAWRRLGTVNGLWIASRAAETAYRIMDEA